MAPPDVSWITPEMRFAWWAITGVMSLAAVAIGWAAKTFWSLAKDAKKKAVEEALEKQTQKNEMTRVVSAVFGDATNPGGLQAKCARAEDTAKSSVRVAGKAIGEVREVKDLLGISDVNLKRKMVAEKLRAASGSDSGDTFSGVREHFERLTENTGSHPAIKVAELPPPAVEVSRGRRPVTGDTTWKGRPPGDDDSGE